MSDTPVTPPANNRDAINRILKAYAESRGLLWDQPAADAAFASLQKTFGNTLSDSVYIAFGEATVDQVARVMNPRSYTWWTRLLMAAQFIFNFHEIK